MTVLDTAFQQLRNQKRAGLIPFITAGDPDLDVTRQLLLGLDKLGCPVIELGIPFSDPIADGPTIQQSYARALEAGVRMEAIWKLTEDVIDQMQSAVVIMVSYSLIMRQGVEAFVQRAYSVGIAGLIVPDLPWEDSRELASMLTALDMHLISLVAPTTPEQRAEQIARSATGFLYVVSSTGTTGVRSDLPPQLSQRLNKLRQATTVPLCVGFGISRAEQVSAVSRMADGIIVGSAFVDCISQTREQPSDVMINRVLTLASEFTAAIDAAPEAGH